MDAVCLFCVLRSDFYETSTPHAVSLPHVFPSVPSPHPALNTLGGCCLHITSMLASIVFH